VFGHTPYERILLHLPFKIGIDTGLVYGNRLSCVELVEGRLFQVDAGATEILRSSILPPQ
jgi:serine/threonine protein phosphatase 1